MEKPHSHRMDDVENVNRNRRLAQKILWMAAGVAVGAVLLVAALYYTTGASIYPYRPSQASYGFTTEGQSILKRTYDGSWSEFTVCGVEIVPMAASAGRYALYLQQLEDAAGLNANTVRVRDVMDPDFYKALAAHNKGSYSPLYLLQGVAAEEEALRDMQDAWNDGLYQLLQERGRLAVDAVHGTRVLQGYSADVGPYVLGYIVGNNWEPGLVRYTNESNETTAPAFSGSYVMAWRTANTFEVILAMALDDLCAYETGKHGRQSLLAVANWQRTDPLFHDTAWTTSVYENLANVNGELMQVHNAVKTGLFAAYHVDVGVWQALSHEPALVAGADENGNPSPWMTYLTALQEYHRLPLVLSDFGVSAARGVSGLDDVNGYHRGGHNENEQADILETLFAQALGCGFSGGCINSLWDSLGNTAWNVAPFVQQGERSWLNAQDSEQKLGLMELVHDSGGFACVIDGEPSEWAYVQLYKGAGENYFQVQFDSQYLYFRFHIPGYNKNTDVLYIPIDTTPLSGTKSDGVQQLQFDRDADFVLSIIGDKRARLMVQEYYDATTAVFGYRMNGTEPFAYLPQAGSNTFVPVQQFVWDAVRYSEQDDQPAQAVEAGLLRHGNGNPGAAAYDSLADYCILGEDIEVRIPWMLLNFANPAEGLILGDLYQPTFETLAIDTIHVGMIVMRGQRQPACESHAVPLTGWEAQDSFRVRPRLAYGRIRDLFASVH